MKFLGCDGSELVLAAGSNVETDQHRGEWLDREESGEEVTEPVLGPTRGRGLQRAAGGDAPRVMLLTSTLGWGHVRAAQAVEIALQGLCPTAEVRTLDFWSLMDAGVAAAVRQTYLRLVGERPEIYEHLYQLDERTWRRILEGGQAPPAALAAGLEMLAPAGIGKTLAKPDGGHHAPVDRVLFRSLCAALPRRIGRKSGSWGSVLHALLKWIWRHLAWRLDARLRAFAPDVVVATQMHPASLLAFIKERGRFAAPAVGVLTDFGVHDFWLRPGIDRYCVAHESIAWARDPGDRASRSVVTGIPLMPGFRNPPGMREARSCLGLDPDRPVVLVLGGGLGLGVEAIAERLLMRPAQLQVLVSGGQNAQALASLTGLVGRHPGRLRVLDWTERMEIFISAADVVVGKPGGLTVAEALACGRPLLATRSLGGQEGYNQRFLEQHGVGALLTEEALAERIESLIANRSELARIRDRAWALGRRDGAARVAELVLALARSHAID